MIAARNNKGFSLVELMVVVAIIGILAAIAIPNFQRFTAKSKQSEAKADLSGIFAANRSFQAEWQTYSPSFSHIGYAPQGTYRYQHGMAGAAAATLPGNYAGPPVAAGDSDTSTWCAQGGVVPLNNCIVNVLPLPPGAYATAPASSPTAFIASAVADISGGAVARDAWQINQAKAIVNDVNGLP